MSISVKQIPSDEIPSALLFDADPSPASVRFSLEGSTAYAVFEGGRAVGACVVKATRPFTQEILNIAVDPAFQRKGIATALIRHAVQEAAAAGYDTLEISTGNAGIDQLKLYQRCGFRICGIDFDYFPAHYPEPIVENGIPCRDRIILSMNPAEIMEAEDRG